MSGRGRAPVKAASRRDGHRPRGGDGRGVEPLCCRKETFATQRTDRKVFDSSGDRRRLGSGGVDRCPAHGETLDVGSNLSPRGAGDGPGAGACAATSRGDFVTLTLDKPDQTVVVPASGSITIQFTGTLTIARGYDYAGGYLDTAWNEDETTSIPTAYGALNFADASNGNTIKGVLFTATISASTPPGDYYTNPLDLLSSLVVKVDGPGGPASTYAAFSIKVLAPEPSTLALTALGGPLAALAFRRRTAAGSRQFGRRARAGTQVP